MAASMKDVGNVEIRQGVTDKGRALFALKDISAGDDLFEDRPLVSSQFLWNAKYNYVACDHCHKSLETAEEMSRRLTENPALVIPYPHCCEVKPAEHARCPNCQVLYCGAACRDAAWEKYHKSLCLGAAVNDEEHPLLKLQEAWRNMHYPPETASIMLLARMIATVQQAPDRTTAVTSFNQFCRATVNEEQEIAHKLLGQQFQENLEMLRALMKEALYEEDLDQWFTPEGFRSMFALVGTNGQGIGTSSLSVWVSNCEQLDLPEQENKQLDAFIDQLYADIDKASGQFLNCEGSGLYLLQSASNHSCVPNAEVTFPYNDSTLVMRAVDDIKAGEEICICYLEECDRERSRHSRQQILRENYLFKCNCPKCQMEEEEPDVTSDEEENMEEEDEDL